LFAALLVLRFLMADDGYPAILSLRAELGKMEAEVARLGGENADLRAKIRALREDPYAVEKIAREELDFAAPGEVVYLFPAELSRRRQESADGTGGRREP
jgi:cell division protein FtsB